jgi:integrase
MNDESIARASRPSDQALVDSLLEPVKRPRSRKSARGAGRIFLRGSKWWIAYYVKKEGRPVEMRESAGNTETEARRLMKRRQDELAAHRLGMRSFRGPQQERVTVLQLLAELERHYELRDLASLRRLRSHLKHIRDFFGNDRALEVTANRISSYMEMRQQAGAANATINRETEGLQRAFTLAEEQDLLSYVPHFKSLPEHNARQGFFERADFEAILPRLTLRGKPDTDLQDYLSWCFFTGMRTGETKALTWADFDRESWTIRLHAKDSKNRKGRAIPLENELRELVERRITARRLDCQYIFHRHGRQMRDFRKVWKRACREAGLVKRIQDEATGTIRSVYPIPHDFRRSAVRNMVRAGVNPDIARQISGHRTPAIFSRYNIISEADLRQAVQQTSDYLAMLPAKPKVAMLKPARESAG